MRCGALLCLVAALALAACSTSRHERPEADAPSPSAARGLAYAQRVCAACHAVTAGEDVSPNPNAPSFEAIANLPGMTPTALNAWLHAPHPTMPSLVVSPSDRADVAAYLQSLKRGANQG